MVVVAFRFAIVYLILCCICISFADATLPEDEIAFHQQKIATPVYLYKIVSYDAWEESVLSNQLCLPPMDAQFIHLATECQVLHVIEKFWSDMDYVILKIESKMMSGHLCYETNPGGSTKYFHLYDGNIPLGAIVSTEPYQSHFKVVF